MKSHTCATWTVLSILLSSVSGQGNLTSSLPQCGQNCFGVAYAEYGRACPSADASCLCAQPGFVPDITSCTNQQCVAATDVNTTLTFTQLYCESASTNSSIGTIIPTTSFTISDALTLNSTTIDVSTLPHTIISISGPGPYTNASTPTPTGSLSILPPGTSSDTGVPVTSTEDSGPITSVISITPTVTATPTASVPSASPGFNAGIRLNNGLGFASLGSIVALALANVLFA